ncbi:MAG: NADH-quinone oxidoreductase subunit L [Bacteriovorax sp.]|jgi:NADH-quinone oxidoreductase subunit L|nr:NADH-quinone oxidoreductase subunit L [Bacteriovorax sp.]
MDYTITTVAPIVLLPFFAFVINAFIVKKFTNLAVAISTGAIFISFLFALRIFADFMNVYSVGYHIHKTFTWFDLSAGSLLFKVNMGIYIDNMTSVMLLMVTAAATLIHVFSTWYMHDDPRFGRFFVYLSLFTSAMLGLVLSDNLLSVFIFWELMGFCSYSLIGFYYEKEGAGNASMKAFMTTRVGDVFFLLGILSLWSVVGSVTFVDIYKAIGSGAFNNVYALGIPLATFAGFSIFMGTMGKSAQVPLQVWLPDAMWGPTPCSALIHAATMVAAGVYLSLRMFPLMELGHLLPFIAIIGGITAFGAATIALVQTDIKAVLAYSTISQLGYMVIGIGVGSYNASFMHLITHAVFKACLFLSAGSVIHSIHCQEMPQMGGLRKKLPYTFFAMLLCCFAIAGVPFFSGFVSKDRILGDALLMALANPVYIPVALLGFAGAFLTAFYMFRMLFLTFYGEPRDHHIYDHAHDEHIGWNSNVPLLILALFTLGLFYSGSFTGQGEVNLFGSKNEWFSTLIHKPAAKNLHHFEGYKSEDFGSVDTRDKLELPKAAYDANHGMSEEEAHHVHQIHHLGAIMSIIIAFSGIFLAYSMYIKKSLNPGWWTGTFAGWTKALKNRYYFDDLYVGKIIQKGLLPFNNLLSKFDMGVYDKYGVDGWAAVNRFAYTVSRWFDNTIIDSGMVDGTGASVRLMNVMLRTLQSGKVQMYFIVMVIVIAGYVWTLSF